MRATRPFENNATLVFQGRLFDRFPSWESPELLEVDVMTLGPERPPKLKLDWN